MEIEDQADSFKGCNEKVVQQIHLLLTTQYPLGVSFQHRFPLPGQYDEPVLRFSCHGFLFFTNSLVCPCLPGVRLCHFLCQTDPLSVSVCVREWPRSLKPHVSRDHYLQTSNPTLSIPPLHCTDTYLH